MLSLGRSLAIFWGTNKKFLQDMFILHMLNVLNRARSLPHEHRQHSWLFGHFMDLCAFRFLPQWYVKRDPESPHHAGLQTNFMWHAECSTQHTISEDRDKDRIEQMDLGLLPTLVLVPQNPGEWAKCSWGLLMRTSASALRLQSSISRCAAKVLKVGDYLNWVRIQSKCDGFRSSK